MAIIYPLSVPTPYIETIQVNEHNISSDSTSPFTAAQNIQDYGQGYWEVTVNFPPMKREDAQPVLAFLSALKGNVGTFILQHPAHSQSLGTSGSVPSTPLVNGGGQAGSTTILLDNLPADQEGWLVPGDIIQVGPNTRPHWHRVLNLVDTDSNGEAEIDIWPPVRADVIDGDPVNYNLPLCLFRLVGNPITHEIGRPIQYVISFTAREVL